MDLPTYSPTTPAATEMYEVAQVLALVGDEAFVREGLLEHLRSRAPVMLASVAEPTPTGSPR